MVVGAMSAGVTVIVTMIAELVSDASIEVLQPFQAVLTVLVLTLVLITATTLFSLRLLLPSGV